MRIVFAFMVGLTLAACGPSSPTNDMSNCPVGLNAGDPCPPSNCGPYEGVTANGTTCGCNTTTEKWECTNPDAGTK